MRRVMLSLFVAVAAAACASEVEDETAEVDPKESFAGEAVAGKADWSIDPCKSRGWYGDGDCDWFCLSPDPDCGPAPLFDHPAGKVARLPIVIHHGFAGGHDWIFAWTGVREALVADGHTVVQTEVPPFDTIAVRASHLKEAVDGLLAQTGAGKVNLIVHSMGGLDARYLISTLGYGDRVASLTTISTPHRGTHAADFGLAVTPGFADAAVNALAALIGAKINDNAVSTSVRGAMTDLSEASSATFNAANADDARVYYQSWAGVSSVLGLSKYGKDAGLKTACDGKLFLNAGTFDRLRAEFVPLSPIVGATGANGAWHDGLVAVNSAKWGTFRGCIPADHSEEVGKFTQGPPNPSTGFDHIRFYRTLAYDLAARGF